MSDRLCIYIRPMARWSAAEQIETLSGWAQLNDHGIVATFHEPERKRGPDRRREASRMLAEAARGHWGRVACVSMLSLCRSVSHASEVLSRFAELGITLNALHDEIDTGCDGGSNARAFALAARFEHAVHVERATVGVRRRIEAGFTHGRPRIPASTEARIVSLIRAGTSTERITRIVGCGKSAIYRIREELKLVTP